MAFLNKHACLFPLLVYTFLLTGCKQPSAGRGAGSPGVLPATGRITSSGVPVGSLDLRKLPGTVFDVKFTPNTVRIDLPTLQRTFRSVSDDGQVVVFESDDARLRNLKAGSVLFLEHVGVRRVLAVNLQGSQIAVLTEQAALTDFIQDGTIQFTVPVDFNDLASRNRVATSRESESPGWDLPWLSPQVAYAGEGGINYSAHIKAESNKWEYELEGEPEGDGIKLSLTVEKKLSALKANLKVEGKLEHVTTSFKAVIHGSKMDDFEYSSPITGSANVNWSVATMASGASIGEARLKLPPFAKGLFDIYGVPFLFRVDESLIFKPGFAGKQDFADGDFHVTYSGTGGLSIHGGQSSPEGAVEAKPEIGSTTAVSMAPHGVIFALAAPKVSVSLGTESFTEAFKEFLPIPDPVAEYIKKGPFGGLFKSPKEDFFTLEGAAYVQLITQLDYAGSGPLGLVPCSMTHLNLYAQAGADASYLGTKAESPKVNIFETKITRRVPDIDACGPKDKPADDGQ